MIIHTSIALLTCLPLLGGDDKPKNTKPPKKSAARITLKQDARLRGKDVLLRDIAVIECSDPRIVQRLRAVSFGPRPNYAHNRILTRQDVSQQLYADGVLARHFKLDGAEQVIVQPLSTTLKKQEILAVATPALEAILALEKKDVEYSVRNGLGLLRVPPGRRSLNLRARIKEKPSRTGARIEVDVVVDGEVFQSVPVFYDLKHYHRVLVTRSVIKKDVVLGAHNLRLDRQPMPYGSTVNLTNIAAVEGRVASRDLRAGENITLAEFRLPAVVRKNEIINLISISGRIKISARVRALEDGARGAFIRVQTLHYKGARILTARVHAAGVAVIQNLNSRRQ